MELNTGAINHYIASLFAPQDIALSSALGEMQREGVPGINVSAVEGKLLTVLARLVGAKRALEVGTLGGYSGQAWRQKRRFGSDLPLSRSSKWRKRVSHFLT